MSETELRGVLSSIDAALTIFGAHEGPIVFREANVKTMLGILKLQIADQLDVEVAATHVG